MPKKDLSEEEKEIMGLTPWEPDEFNQPLRDPYHWAFTDDITSPEADHITDLSAEIANAAIQNMLDTSRLSDQN